MDDRPKGLAFHCTLSWECVTIPRSTLSLHLSLIGALNEPITEKTGLGNHYFTRQGIGSDSNVPDRNINGRLRQMVEQRINSEV